ncbi:flagellar assembly peptidoglycan hydrolase FlgJ [Halomonas pacifica]|uniref:flagellar assembly peptidoglycan hydrolase FlgJ n=1 Tax=Bisbaumannia pacifica TaxID=77098 RepID=UPI002359D503|nr:flagellar assembly peptidoglycan hydrolase FlgJ [Halomonas pacifica]MDC8803497.1 flagellar assembly peptidoglycan hydrolase FlgJ [Halomonas pacifica]
MSANDLSGQFALDVQGIQRLRHTARQDERAGLEGAAQQFEALFLQRMLKSMRAAIPESDLMNSQQTRFYTELHDQQLAQHLSARGGGMGLAEELVRQLEGHLGSVAPNERASELIAGIPRGTPRPLTSMGEQAPADFMQALAARPAGGDEPLRSEAPVEAPAVRAASGERAEHVQAFVERLAEPARRASEASGVPAELILAQAALETGWGRRGIPTRDGGESHNLFGIKAGRHWRGETTEIVTHEYIDGQRTRISDHFRVYDSYAEAFTDYARLIGDNPRYAGVTAAGNARQAAHALQAGGYATDPQYADKLISIMDSLGPLPEGPRLASR